MQEDTVSLTRTTLRNPEVRRAVGAFAGVMLGEWVLGTAVAVQAFSMAGALGVGLVGFRFVPAALAGLWTTRLADHAQRHHVLAVTAAARAGAVAGAAIALALDLPFAVVIALVWLDAAIGSGYIPTQAALLPTLVRTPGELTAATRLVSLVKSFGQMMGPLLGGLLVARFAIEVPVAIAALLQVAAMTLTAGIRRSRPFVRAIGGVVGVRAGVQVLRQGCEARFVVVFAWLRSMTRGLWVALAVVASLRLLSLGRSGVGILMAAAGVGTLVAILITRGLVGNRRLGGWYALGLVLCGLPIALVGITGSAALALILIAIWGFGMALADVGAQALLNRIVPATTIGPVTGASECAKLLFEGVGGFVAALLIVAFGIRGALLVAGAALPVMVVLGRRGFARVDARAVARQDVLELLQGIRFFQQLPLDALEGVAARLQVETHPAGAEIVRQGDVDGQHWFLVDQGELVVEVNGFIVGELRRGSQFGELALLRGTARAATIRAVTSTVLRRLDRSDFLAAVAAVDPLGPVPLAPTTPQRVDPSAALEPTPLVRLLRSAALGGLIEGSRVHEVDAGAATVTSGEGDDIPPRSRRQRWQLHRLAPRHTDAPY